MAKWFYATFLLSAIRHMKYLHLHQSSDQNFYNQHEAKCFYWVRRKVYIISAVSFTITLCRGNNREKMIGRSYRFYRICGLWRLWVSWYFAHGSQSICWSIIIISVQMFRIQEIRTVLKIHSFFVNTRNQEPFPSVFDQSSVAVFSSFSDAR